MSLRPYEQLSRVYDLDWGDFALQYIDMIETLLKGNVPYPADVLDLACGTGGLLIELARRGHGVYGIDRSPEMIDRARSKSRGMANIEFDVCDMRAIRLNRTFDLVTCTFDSLNYITRLSDILDIFRGVALHLRNPGYFVFDFNTQRQYTNNHNFAQAYELDGIRFIQRMTYDRHEREATTVFEFGDGSREIHVQRPYTLTELRPHLRRLGLRIHRRYSGFRGERFTSRSQRLICIARMR
jgi:SAM-dependent methyltransferase